MRVNVEAYYMSLLLGAQILVGIGGHVMNSNRIEYLIHILFVTTTISRLVHLDVANRSHCK
jgi:hypothetical protein